jgi:hypothetical protein
MAALEGVTSSQDELEASAGGDKDVVQYSHSNGGNGSGHTLGGRKGQAIAEALSAAEEIAAEMDGGSPAMSEKQKELGGENEG